jgi:anti-sigma factor RsiW
MALVHLTEDQLRRYFLGEGDNDEAGPVEEHLLACDQCAAMAVYVEASVELCWNARHGESGAN